MKNILMSLVLVSTLVLSACTGCKKEETKEVVVPTTEVAPQAPSEAPSVTVEAPATEAAPETK